MRVRYIDTIFGFSIPKRELYYHCLMHDEEFRKHIEDKYVIPEDDFTIDELCNVAGKHIMEIHLDGTMKEQYIDETIHKSLWDLEDRLYPGTTFTIFMNHAEEEFNTRYKYCIVGVRILEQVTRNTDDGSDGGMGPEAIDEMNRLINRVKHDFGKNTDLAASKRELKLFTILGGY
jgi:hypothetical protein